MSFNRIGASKLLSALLIFAFSFVAWATNPKIDQRILQRMDETGITRSAKVHDGSETVKEPVRVIVHLKNDVDIAPLRELGDRVGHIQNEFLMDLRAENILQEDRRQKTRSGYVAEDGFQVEMLMDYQYAVVGTLTSANTLEQLADREDVVSIEFDQLNELFTVQGRAVVGSDQVAAAGYGGNGIGVAVIDSHFDLLHSELGGSTTLPNGTVYDGKNFSDPGTSIHSRNMNDCYHGTGTASIVKRYAPEASLYALTVFPKAYDSVIADAINWCVTNKNGSNGGAPIKVISMSLGGGRNYSECNSGLMHTAAGNAKNNGILVFAASGNEGYPDSMGSPACSSNVISVGSTWDANNAGYSPFPPANCSDTNRVLDEKTCYTSTASFLDLYAPSEEVMCARCGGGTSPLGGTSSACPAAAGMTAQLLSVDASYANDQAGLVSLYQRTGVNVIGDTGKKRINLKAAVDSLNVNPTNELKNNESVSINVAKDATKTFTISIPANASNLKVEMAGSTGDLDLYVKNAAISWPSEKGKHDTDTFKAPYAGGSNESVTFASPAAGTWHVLVHGYAAGSATLKASWTVGNTQEWTYVSYVKESPHPYGNNQTYEFTYEKAGASQVAVHFTTLDTESNYDWIEVYDANNTRVFRISGNLISNGTGNAFNRTDGWLIVNGSKARVRLVSDYSVTRTGYVTDKAGYKN